MVEEYEGTYRRDFEVSLFTPDDGAESWWVDPRSMRRGRALRPDRAGRVVAHVRVKGKLSEPGRHGHLGMHRHELRVTRVVSARRIDEEPPWHEAPPPSARPSIRSVTLLHRQLVDLVVTPDGGGVRATGDPSPPPFPPVIEVRCEESELDAVARAWSALAPDVHVGWVSGPQVRGTRVLHAELTRALGFAEAVRSWPALSDRLAHRAWPRAGNAVVVVTTASELLLDAPRVELATFVRAVEEAASAGAGRLTVVLQTAGAEADLLQRRLQADHFDVPRLAVPAALRLDAPDARGPVVGPWVESSDAPILDPTGELVAPDGTPLGEGSGAAAPDERVLVQRTFDAASDDEAVAVVESATGVVLHRHHSPMIGPWWTGVDPAEGMATQQASGRPPAVDVPALGVQLERNDPEPGVVPVAVPGGAAYVVRLRVPPHLRDDVERRLAFVLRLLDGQA